MNAIMLCRRGMNQETSDPQAAIKTLRQAREASTAATSHGGGGNPAVIHNDAVIAHALLIAMADAAKTPENATVTGNNTAANTAAESQNPNQKTGGTGNNPARHSGNRIQANLKVR